MARSAFAAIFLGALAFGSVAYAQGNQPAPNPTNQQADPAAGGSQSKPGTPAQPGPQGGPQPGGDGGAGASGQSGQTPDTSGTKGAPGGKSGPAPKQ